MSEPFKDWALLELMGHRQVPGFVEDVELAGARFLRVRVPRVVAVTRQLDLEKPRLEQLYSPGAVYCLTPTTEAKIAELLWGGGTAYLPALPPPGSPDEPEAIEVEGKPEVDGLTEAARQAPWE